jgi:hypothetical protein
MQKLELTVTIDTPYLTVAEYAKRSGQSESLIRKEIGKGRIPIRHKEPGNKGVVLINMVQLCAQATLG